MYKIFFLVIAFSISFISHAQMVKIKNLTTINGFRDNALLGFGLVVGLRGTGDSKKSLITNKAAARMLTRIGINSDGNNLVGGSIAAVLVTANLKTFSKNGNKIDVKLSTIGDASSLAGGTLVMTRLKASNNQVFAIAQGSVVIGTANNSSTKILTVAKIVDGAIVEREFEPNLTVKNKIILSLTKPDFTSSIRIEKAINRETNGFYAKALNPNTVTIEVPELYQENLVEFISLLENIEIKPSSKARVVINERTGTIIMGQDVIIRPVTIAHSDLSIRIANKMTKDAINKNVINVGGSPIGNLIETLNALGVKPKDLISILQSLKSADALDAEIIID